MIDSYMREKRYIKKDGRFVWVNVTASLQRSDNGEPLYAILVIEDITFRKNAELRQRMLVGELSHRVKNIMSMVQSIANQGVGLSSEPERFLAAFRARLQAMARAHDLLTHESWQRAELSELIRSQVTLNGVIEDGRIGVEGPSVMLPGQLALNLALVLHELASNALRHGALSTSIGTIDIEWTIADGEEPKVIDLTWREINGPAVKPPTEFGFGAKLVDRLLKRGLGAEVEVTWDQAGLIIRFRLPIPEIAARRLFHAVARDAGYITSAVTAIIPRSVMPRTFAAAGERSSTRSLLEWAAIVNSHDNTASAAWIGDAHAGAERQRAMGRRELGWIEFAPARNTFTLAVIGGFSGESARVRLQLRRCCRRRNDCADRGGKNANHACGVACC